MISIPFLSIGFDDGGGINKSTAFVAVITEVLFGSKAAERLYRRICGLMIRLRWKEKKIGGYKNRR